MFNDIIMRESTPINVYYVKNTSKENGVLTYEYGKKEILAVFQPNYSTEVRGYISNKLLSKYTLITQTNYNLGIEDYVEYQNNIFKIKKVYNWNDYGVMQYECRLATITEKRNLNKFIEGVPYDIK